MMCDVSRMQVSTAELKMRAAQQQVKLKFLFACVCVEHVQENSYIISCTCIVLRLVACVCYQSFEHDVADTASEMPWK